MDGSGAIVYRCSLLLQVVAPCFPASPVPRCLATNTGARIITPVLCMTCMHWHEMSLPMWAVHSLVSSFSINERHHFCSQMKRQFMELTTFAFMSLRGWNIAQQRRHPYANPDLDHGGE